MESGKEEKKKNIFFWVLKKLRKYFIVKEKSLEYSFYTKYWCSKNIQKREISFVLLTLYPMIFKGRQLQKISFFWKSDL